MEHNDLLNHYRLSPKITALIKHLENKDTTGIKEFWTSLEFTGTPLVEEIQGDCHNVLVTFIYKEKEPVHNVLVYGAVPGYRYDENLLERLPGSDIWFKTYKVRNDVRFRYRLSINYEMDQDYWKIKKNSFIDPLNPHRVEFIRNEEDPKSEDFMDSLVTLPEFKEHKWTGLRPHNKKGSLELTRYTSNILSNSRRLWIYKPHGYSEQNAPYNLLVLTDGFDYISWMGAKTVLDNVIEAGEILPVFCILIDNTENRSEELTCSDDFSRFLTEELMPHVQKSYNVTRKPEDTIIGGVSYGGLSATYSAFKNPHIFGKVLSQSGSYWYESQFLTKEFEKAETLPISFYLNAGVLEDHPYDTEPIMMEVINNMRDTLLSKGYNVKYENFYSGHDYLGWGETLATGLIALIGKE